MADDMGTTIIPADPPWIVEIDGTRYVAPEQVVLLLKQVSIERDELRDRLEMLESE